MYINEQTAQLILDAIAWNNRVWMNSFSKDWQDGDGKYITQDEEVSDARADFVRFCRARGIEGVEKEVKVNVDW